VDHVSDFNLPYTEHARRNLLAEGLHPRRVMVSGSPMKEVLDYYSPKIKSSEVLKSLELNPQGYFLVSAHRQENVDSAERLQDLLGSLTEIYNTWGLPILVSTHPRTRKKLESTSSYKETKGVIFHEPFGFIDYNHLQLNAKCVLSDSGTISEESSILGFPAVTIRDSMEGPEAIESGVIVMTGLKPANIIAGIRAVIATHGADPDFLKITLPSGYDVLDFSTRVLKFVLSTATRHHEWAGVRKLG
jgi:UDP-N-acetylglucosamine 2-epimerase (non-hydrolysing)